MSLPSEVIYQALIDLGLGEESSGDWTTFIGFLPDLPDKAICVYDTVGGDDGRVMISGERIIHPGIQIRVRGVDYKTTYEKIDEIAKALDGVVRLTVAPSSEDTYTLHNVSRKSPIIPAGVDEMDARRRHHFTINVEVTLSSEET